MEKSISLGDSPESIWLLEFLDRCFPESGEKVSADLNLAMAMCKAEPKCAQVAMQLLSQNIRSGLIGEPKTVFTRFALGVLFTAYVGIANIEGRCNESGLPPELELPILLNPEIIACANELGPIEDGGDK